MGEKKYPTQNLQPTRERERERDRLFVIPFRLGTTPHDPGPVTNDATRSYEGNFETLLRNPVDFRTLYNVRTAKEGVLHSCQISRNKNCHVT
ncbi:hypothetical protein GWI33_006445 [Rhynchophorus ferrugineus]|uniref:Uncharacterized protein n=1 Tax=Rhynchophorus ferrugineus TaxID=354439 RepID=A0A834IUJ9_RHYFE|nr:hypothetical protein GWI33_006445 [Rhynchophorus ferrugineus]